MLGCAIGHGDRRGDHDKQRTSGHARGVWSMFEQGRWSSCVCPSVLAGFNLFIGLKMSGKMGLRAAGDLSIRKRWSSFVSLLCPNAPRRDNKAEGNGMVPGYPTSFWNQTACLMWRALMASIRNPFDVGCRLVMCLSIGILCGLVFINATGGTLPRYSTKLTHSP